MTVNKKPQTATISDSRQFAIGSGNEPHTPQLSFEFAPKTINVRIEMQNGEPWFAATDVCTILEIDNTSQAVSRLDDDEKGIISSDTLKGQQELLFVNESGLYNLIFQSRKPEAKKFRKWVTSEVLPSIRKTGSYGKNLMLEPGQNPFATILQYCRKQQQEGKTWYAANQLRRLTGRGGNIKEICQRLSQQGKAKLLPEANQDKWYITQDAIPDLLAIQPSNLVNLALIEMIKAGGSHA